MAIHDDMSFGSCRQPYPNLVLKAQIIEHEQAKVVDVDSCVNKSSFETRVPRSTMEANN